MQDLSTTSKYQASCNEHVNRPQILYLRGATGFAVSTIRLFHYSLAKVQGALDAVEAVKTGVEQHSRMAEKSAVQVFASIRAAVDSREKAVLEVSAF